jgi:hypothetical protein
MRTGATHTNNYRDAALFGLTIGTAIGTSIALTQRMVGQHRMPNLKTWQKALIEKHGEIQGAFLAARTQARYEAFYNERPHFTHPALRWHLEQKILPGLALYHVLSEQDSNHEAVLAEVGSLLEIGLRDFLRCVYVYRYFPLPFTVMRQLFKASLLAFPRQGWDIEQVETSKTSFAFNVHRCFYLDVLTAYGAPELTPLYCRLDDLLYAHWSPSIRWERTKTLGRGDDCCDFRYSRGESEKATSALIQVQSRVKREAAGTLLSSST